MNPEVVLVYVDDVGDLIHSKLKDLVVDRLKNVDCVALLGPRQVGKTTLAYEIGKNFPDGIYLDLESAADCKQLGNREEFFVEHPTTLIILDEILCRPDLFSILRSQIDQRRREFGSDGGSFFILGSDRPT